MVIYALSCIAVSWVWFIVLVLAMRIFKTLDTGGGLMIVLNKCSALVMRGAAIYLGAALLFLKKELPNKKENNKCEGESDE